MKKFLLSLLILASLSTHAQTKADPVRIADETTLEYNSNGTKMKIVCDNEGIAKKLIDKYTKCQCINYSFRFKKDRHGTYGEWIIYIPTDHQQDVLALLK